MRKKCALCKQPVEKSRLLERLVSMGFDVSEVSNLLSDMEEHMAFAHGFNRAYKNNVSEGVAEAYYRVVSEPLEIEGKTYRFGDYIEIKRGKVVVHAPGGIYQNNDSITLEMHYSGTIP